MPGGHLVIFDDVGHFPHCEDPERFVEALEEFISSTPPAHVSEAQWRGLLRSSQEVETAFGGDIARLRLGTCAAPIRPERHASRLTGSVEPRYQRLRGKSRSLSERVEKWNYWRCYYVS